MAQVGPIAPLATLATGAATAPQAIQQQAPTTYCKRFAGMGDLYGGAYLPILQVHCPEAVLTPAMVAQTMLNLSLHGGLPSFYTLPDAGHTPHPDSAPGLTNSKPPRPRHTMGWPHLCI